MALQVEVLRDGQLMTHQVEEVLRDGQLMTLQVEVWSTI